MAYQHNCDPQDPEVQDDIKEINELNAAAEGKLSWRELFSNGKDMNLWRFSVACGSQACQQITVRMPFFKHERELMSFRESIS